MPQPLRFALLFSLLLGIGNVFGNADVPTTRVDCEDALPAEICNQYDPEVLSGNRPSFWFPDEDDVFDLANCADRNTDYINTEDFPSPSSLSSAQVAALKQWLSDCQAKIYITGSRGDEYLELLMGLATDESTRFSEGRLEIGHPVGTGVENIRLSCRGSGITSPLPDDNESVVLVTDGNRNPCIVSFRFGSSLVVYDGLTSFPNSPDRVRMVLNLRQCLIGKDIPEATVPSNCRLEETQPVLLETLTFDGTDPSVHVFKTMLTVGRWYKLLIFSEVKISRFENIPSQAHFNISNGAYGDFSFLNTSRQPVMRMEILLDAQQEQLAIQFLDAPNSYQDNLGLITVHLLRVVTRE